MGEAQIARDVEREPPSSWLAAVPSSADGLVERTASGTWRLSSGGGNEDGAHFLAEGAETGGRQAEGLGFAAWGRHPANSPAAGGEGTVKAGMFCPPLTRFSISEGGSVRW